LIKNAAVARVVETEPKEHRVRLDQKVTKEMLVLKVFRAFKDNKDYRVSQD
jgi:hypothetical protein